MKPGRSTLIGFTLVACLVGGIQASLAQTSIYVTDSIERNGNPRRARILEVNRLNGDRRIASGPTMFLPMFAVVDPATGIVYVTDQGIDIDSVDGHEAIWSFDSINNRATLVSGMGYGTGLDFWEIYGIALEPGGTLVVVDDDRNQLLRVDIATGNRTPISGAGVGAGPSFDRPRDVAVMPNGELVVSDFGRDAIFRVNPGTGDRGIMSNSVVPPSATNFSLPLGLTVEPAGTVLVVDADLNAIIRVEPSTGSRTVISSNSTSPIALPAFIDPEDVMVTPGGTILISDLGLNAILSLDGLGNRAILSGNTSFGSVGTGPVFIEPRGLVLGVAGRILAADAGQSLLISIDPANQGNREFMIGCIRGAGDEALTLEGITSIDGTQLFIANNEFPNQSVIRVDLPSGNRTTVSQDAVSAPPDFAFLSGLAVESAQSLLATDYDANRLLRIDLATGARMAISDSTHGTGPGFNNPIGVVRGSDGRYFVADISLNAVIKVDPANFNRSAVSSAGVTLADPFGIALEASGQIVITDQGRGAIFRLDPDNAGAATVSGDPTGLNVGVGVQFDLPRSIAVEPEGGLVVADQDLRAVVRVDPVSGNRTIISGFDPVSNMMKGQGPNLTEPVWMALANSIPPDSPTPIPTQTPTPLPTATPEDCADENHDGVVDAADVTFRILRQ